MSTTHKFQNKLFAGLEQDTQTKLQKLERQSIPVVTLKAGYSTSVGGGSKYHQNTAEALVVMSSYDTIIDIPAILIPPHIYKQVDGMQAFSAGRLFTLNAQGVPNKIAVFNDQLPKRVIGYLNRIYLEKRGEYFALLRAYPQTTRGDLKFIFYRFPDLNTLLGGESRQLLTYDYCLKSMPPFELKRNKGWYHLNIMRYLGRFVHNKKFVPDVFMSYHMYMAWASGNNFNFTQGSLFRLIGKKDLPELEIDTHTPPYAEPEESMHATFRGVVHRDTLVEKIMQ